MKPAPLLNTNLPSMTEWFAAIGADNLVAAFREEDNQKSNRLEVLYQELGALYERPEKFEATDLRDLTLKFEQLLLDCGDDLCAIRLVPKKSGLPKLRQRGVSLRDCYEKWFKVQNINAEDYEAHICPHSESLLWSITFVVNEKGIFGEVIEGFHTQLTHGLTEKPLFHFYYDFNEWHSNLKDVEALNFLKQIVDSLYVTNHDKQLVLKNKIGADFAHNYLCGYFEATVWPNQKAYLIDFNQLLASRIISPDFNILLNQNKTGLLKGFVAYAGEVDGRVVVVGVDEIAQAQFNDGDILVCDVTDVRYLPLMRRAGGIITNRGGILSHAAIVARELKKPCLVGTGLATTTLQTGQRIKLDGVRGVVYELQNS